MSAVANPAKLLGESTGHHGAHAYILYHDERVKMLDRQSLHVLRDLWDESQKLHGTPVLLGGPDDHDSFVHYIAGLEFPDIERARGIYSEWVLVQQPAIGEG